MALSLSGEKGSSVLLILLAGLVGYVAYTGTLLDTFGMKGLKQQKETIAAIQDTIAKLQAATDSAKRELAHGTVEDLRKRLDVYRGSLSLLRRLVPERNEVPNLLDDISTRAKIRGVNLAEVSPLPEERGPAPFATYKYNMRVMGHYDQIGEFLGDIASLQRIIVPVDLTIAPANPASAKALGDSSGAMLEARFQIRTYVKSASAAEGEASGT
jgi:type IV pilus assembly protein PilO